MAHGILSWMIEGCLEWQADGAYSRPAVVRKATACLPGRRRRHGTVGSTNAAQRDPQAWELTDKLFASWSSWAARAGEPIGSKKSFHQNLETRGYLPDRKHAGRGFYGLGSAQCTSSTELARCNG